MKPCHKLHDSEPTNCRICWLYENDNRYNKLWGGSGIAKKLGIIKKAWNFGKAVTQHIAAGLPVVSKDKFQKRITTCKGCELYDNGSCQKCGCNMVVKATWAEQKCPLGKWEEWPVKLDHTNLAVNESGYRFNSSLIEWKGKYLLAFRNGWAGSDIFLVELDRNFNEIKGTVRKLGLTHPTEATYGREDPRLFIFRDKLHVSYVGVVGNPIHTSVLYARLTDDFRVDQVFYPHYSDRSLWEKNWVFFEHDGNLYSVYSIKPHRVLKIEENSANLLYYSPYKSLWSEGEMRGGSTPVKVGNEFYSFFHSRLEVNGHRYYRIGVYVFSASPPFQVKRITPESIMIADRSTKPGDQYASVVFPCGSVRVGNDWIVSMGVHDRWTELHKFSQIYLESKMIEV